MNKYFYFSGFHHHYLLGTIYTQMAYKVTTIINPPYTYFFHLRFIHKYTCSNYWEVVVGQHEFETIPVDDKRRIVADTVIRVSESI